LDLRRRLTLGSASLLLTEARSCKKIRESGFFRKIQKGA
jgi:hypothetical protein